MVKDAEAHAGEAHKLRELADAKNMAESLAYQTEKSLADHRDKLDPADAATLEGRVMELKQVLESGDLETIREKTQALNEAAQPLAQALYADAQAGPAPSGATGATGNGEATPDQDEVVEDADFEVIDDETATKA
jgi:molecular chaperone DnaK